MALSHKTRMDESRIEVRSIMKLIVMYFKFFLWYYLYTNTITLINSSIEEDNSCSMV